MTKKNLLASVMTCLALVIRPSAVIAEVAEPLDNRSDAPVSGWDELIEALRALPRQMIEKPPPDLQQDPQTRQEIVGLALQSFTMSAMDAIGGDGDYPEFLPSFGLIFNVAQPNVDTIYRMARITRGGSYRITGKAGTASVAVVSQAVPRKSSQDGVWPELDLLHLKTDESGRYSVVLSAERPDGYAGDWWALNPEANQLMLRFISEDWARDRAPTISIERIDRPIRRGRDAAGELEHRLAELKSRTTTFATMFFDREAKLRAEGYVNRFKPNVPEGALGRQSNYEGIFELEADEALILETALPKHCEYRSLLLVNDLYQTVDWYNNQSSLNGAEAKPDSDGKLRIVISAQDPGVRNWIDTSGHRRGILKGRWTGCDSHPLPELRRVKFREVRRKLPKDTALVSPEERDQIVRERRRAMLERSLW
jgi:hypothetical protein